MPKQIRHEPHSGIKLHLDGRLDAWDFGRLIQICNDLYNLHVYAHSFSEVPLFQEIMRDWPSPFDFDRTLFRKRLFYGPDDDVLTSITSVMNDFREKFDTMDGRPRLMPALQVARIQYASPGFTDLAGVGVIVGHIKDFFLTLIEHALNRRQRQSLAEKADLENELLKIEVLHKAVEVLRESGFSKNEIKSVVQSLDDRADDVQKLAFAGKLVGVTLLDNAGRVGGSPHGDSPKKRPSRAISFEEEEEEEEEGKDKK